MKKRKKAIIDIDNTLWHFCDMLFEQLQKINRSFPSPDGWIDWDFWQHFCSEEEFITAINNVHFNQDDDRHIPYPAAKQFLQTLKDEGFHITIASRRSEGSRIATKRWLHKHELPFDELHISFNKTALFEADYCVVVDDSPKVLEKAKQRGLMHTGLLFPWNRLYSENGYLLFNSLDEILQFILNQPHR
jgi:hypothetical protein